MTINYLAILSLILALLFALFGLGFYLRIRQQITELVRTVQAALADGTITPIELAQIFKEAGDVRDVLFELAVQISKAPARRAPAARNPKAHQ